MVLLIWRGLQQEAEHARQHSRTCSLTDCSPLLLPPFLPPPTTSPARVPGNNNKRTQPAAMLAAFVPAVAPDNTFLVMALETHARELACNALATSEACGADAACAYDAGRVRLLGHMRAGAAGRETAWHCWVWGFSMVIAWRRHEGAAPAHHHSVHHPSSHRPRRAAPTSPTPTRTPLPRAHSAPARRPPRRCAAAK